MRREGLVIKRSTTVCSRQLFAWNEYTLPPVRSSVWERKPWPVEPEDDPEEEDMCPELLLQCHDYDQRPESCALDMACEKIQAQQLAIEELQNRLAVLSLQQTFGLQRFSASDDDIRFFTRLLYIEYYIQCAYCITLAMALLQSGLCLYSSIKIKSKYENIYIYI